MRKILYTLLFVPLLLLAQNENPCYSINDIFIQMDGENPSLEVNLVAGWNMIGYPCSQDMLLTDGFSSIDNIIEIVKDNNGNVYMPEFGFNGIGFLEGGQGYQIKMNEFVMGFSFCQSVMYPNLEGCTDCEAVNFSKLATTDDGSCSYDSDGDGIDDVDEIIGCQDILACNNDITATDAGECTYADDGYDCEGNQIFEIGDIANGGIVFYVDDSKQRGLVVSDTILFSLSEYFYFGCAGTNLNTSSDESVGVGLENSIRISANCNEEFNAASGALNFEKYGYDDWYLPSMFELELLNSNMGYGSENYHEDIHQIFNGLFFWSSTENENDLSCSWGIYFYEQEEANSYCNYRGSFDAIRPIRLFGDWDVGCIDATACNYDVNAQISNSNLCEYPPQGYDCEGNITEYVIGMEAEGGIVFYVDETGEHGLVAATEDLSESYEWGCYGTFGLLWAEGLDIGSGYQNTLDIVNQGCLTESGGLTAAQAALDLESEDYSDWYLPSIDELVVMGINIGGSDSGINVGEFQQQNYWSSSKYFEPWMANESRYATMNVNSNYTLTNFRNSPFLVRPIRTF